MAACPIRWRDTGGTDRRMSNPWRSDSMEARITVRLCIRQIMASGIGQIRYLSDTTFLLIRQHNERLNRSLFCILNPRESS